MQFSEVSILYPEFEKTCSKPKEESNCTICMHSIPKSGRTPQRRPDHYGVVQFNKYPALQSFGSAAISYFAVMQVDNVVSEVSLKLSNSDWLVSKNALIEKFGAPHSSESSTIQNRAGASFDQEVLSWDDGDLMLTATKRSSSVDDMSVRLGSRTAMIDANKKMQEDAKVQAKNL